LVGNVTHLVYRTSIALNKTYRQSILGHEDIETTKEFYAHVPHEDMRAAMERMSVFRMAEKEKA
jgi:site-specific recombinase XerD